MPSLFLRRSPLGNSVFAGQPFRFGEPILEYGGSPYTASEMSDAYMEDHSLQIGPDTHLGPTGGIDDYVNHSCDPNCGIVIVPERVLLVAIRDVAAEEELTFDYSTTMIGGHWSMDGCRCGTSLCRGHIGDFAGLPAARRRHYQSVGVVPRYVLRPRAARVEYGRRSHAPTGQVP